MLPRWSRGQWVLRWVIVLGLVLALLATGPAGTYPGPRWVAVVTAAALGAATLPASGAPLAGIGLVLAWWGGGPTDPLHPMVLVAGALLVAVHLAAMLAASGPAAFTPSRGLVRTWVRRGVVIWLPVPVLYAVARGLAGRPEPPAVWAIGAAAALVAVAAASWVAGRPLAPASARRDAAPW